MTYNEKLQDLQNHKELLSNRDYLDRLKKIDNDLQNAILSLVKEKLNTAKIAPDMIFQDGFTIYYNGNYVGNIQHLFDKEL